MAYLTARRYGLTFGGPADPDRADELRAAGWRQVWRHPSGALAMRHPVDGRWRVSMDGRTIADESFANSLRGAARAIERRLRGSVG